MARKKKTGSPAVEDYRHDSARRKNNPPANLAAEGTVPAVPKERPRRCRLLEELALGFEPFLQCLSH